MPKKPAIMKKTRSPKVSTGTGYGASRNISKKSGLMPKKLRVKYLDQLNIDHPRGLVVLGDTDGCVEWKLVGAYRFAFHLKQVLLCG
jgi:hypothetical protein